MNEPLPGLTAIPVRKSGTARRVAQALSPYRWHFTLLVASSAVGAALLLLPALLIGQIVDEATLEDSDMTRMAVLFGIVIAMFAGSILLTTLSGYISVVISQGVIYTLRSRMYERLQRVSPDFRSRTPIGEVVSRVVNDARTAQEVSANTLMNLTGNFFLLLIATIMLFALDWRLATAAAAVLIIWMIPTLLFGNHLRRLRGEWLAETGRMSARVEETLSAHGSAAVHAFGRQSLEADRFERSNETVRALGSRVGIQTHWFSSMTMLFGPVAIATVYWIGSMTVADGGATFGNVVAFAVITQRMFTPFATVSRLNVMALASLAAFERMFDYLDLPLGATERPGAETLESATGRVSMEDVTFRYPEAEVPAVEGVNLELAPGRIVALAGPSGAGKSTLSNLLQRYYDPQEGRVTLDDHDLRDLTLASVSGAIGTVMQEATLFHASLADNIRYGRPDATDEQVRAAAHAAGLDRVIQRLDHGLDTIVGERGSRLSGGERQRVAIARAMVKEPPVLILDEATGSLDTNVEAEIWDTLRHVTADRATLVISHRPAIIASADYIYVLDAGRVVASGSHQELLRSSPLYAELNRNGK